MNHETSTIEPEGTGFRWTCACGKSGHRKRRTWARSDWRMHRKGAR